MTDFRPIDEVVRPLLLQAEARSTVASVRARPARQMVDQSDGFGWSVLVTASGGRSALHVFRTAPSYEQIAAAVRADGWSGPFDVDRIEVTRVRPPRRERPRPLALRA
ncbi:MAG: hypothetical protein AAGK21_04005 [Bacteroidota bacterium]